MTRRIFSVGTTIILYLIQYTQCLNYLFIYNIRDGVDFFFSFEYPSFQIFIFYIMYKCAIMCNTHTALFRPFHSLIIMGSINLSCFKRWLLGWNSYKAQSWTPIHPRRWQLAFIIKLVQSEMMRKFTGIPHVITAVKTELKFLVVS